MGRFRIEMVCQVEAADGPSHRVLGIDLEITPDSRIGRKKIRKPIRVRGSHVVLVLIHQ